MGKNITNTTSCTGLTPKIHKDPKPLTTDEIVMSLLLRGLVLEYNGERWCGIHPAIEDFLFEKGEISG